MLLTIICLRPRSNPKPLERWLHSREQAEKDREAEALEQLREVESEPDCFHRAFVNNLPGITTGPFPRESEARKM